MLKEISLHQVKGITLESETISNGHKWRHLLIHQKGGDFRIVLHELYEYTASDFEVNLPKDVLNVPST